MFAEGDDEAEDVVVATPQNPLPGWHAAGLRHGFSKEDAYGLHPDGVTVVEAPAAVELDFGRWDEVIVDTPKARVGDANIADATPTLRKRTDGVGTVVVQGEFVRDALAVIGREEVKASLRGLVRPHPL